MEKPKQLIYWAGHPIRTLFLYRPMKRAFPDKRERIIMDALGGDFLIRKRKPSRFPKSF